MTSHIALLRGINVGGKAIVPMADLKKLFEALGLSDVKTLLQSGNVIFKSKSATGAKLEAMLEKEIEKKFGRPVDCIVRTDKEWSAIIKANPFPKEAVDDPSHCVVMCLKDAPDAKAVIALKEAIPDREYFQSQGKELYLVYLDGIGTSKLTNVLIEKKLGTRGTARNWNTAQKIAALFAAK
jgi:uncharacterized protein (DUF1697 family)